MPAAAAAARLSVLCKHLVTAPLCCEDTTLTAEATVAPRRISSHGFTLEELELGDAPEVWERAGFHVSSGYVQLGPVRVQLSGGGGGLRRLVFGSPPDRPAVPELLLPGLQAAASNAACTIAVDSGPHPNSCIGLGEVVLYAQQLLPFVRALAAAGVDTHRGRAPRPIKGGDHAIAMYFLGDIRMLVCGPTDPAHPPAKNSHMWMFGRGEAEVELTGWLPIVSSMAALHATCAEVGAAKAAAQQGRSIATLRAGAIEGVTGTFAFLSDGDGPLF